MLAPRMMVMRWGEDEGICIAICAAICMVVYMAICNAICNAACNAICIIGPSLSRGWLGQVRPGPLASIRPLRPW